MAAKANVTVAGSTPTDITAIALDTLGAPTDVTTLNASSSKHGLMPKLAADATKFFDSNGGQTIPQSRWEIMLTARGLITEAWPLLGSSCTLSGVGATGASSNLVGSLVGLRKGETITNVITFVGNAGSGVTLAKLALFDKTGTLLAVTADVKASIAANSPLVGALGTPYVVPASDGYYLAVLTLASTTQPTLARATSQSGVGKVIGSGVRPAFNVASQSDISGNVTLADGSNGYWLACS